MKAKVNRESPFEYLRRRKDNSLFPEDTVRNWYIARAFVLARLHDISFLPDSGRNLHVVVDGDSQLMLAVLRQVALSAHYANFVEYDQFDRLVCRNRTVITLISQMRPDEILQELEKEENLGNLPRYCRRSVFGNVDNEDSFLDLELQVVKEPPLDSDCIWFRKEDVDAFVSASLPEEIYTIDTRKAVYAGRVYSLGSVIDNLPYEDINSVGRYGRALDTFQYKVLHKNAGAKLVTPQWTSDSSAVLRGISNIFCADCFETGESMILQQFTADGKDDRKTLTALWEENNDFLSRCEHNRWVVEKLIMGSRPFNEQERIDFERLFGKSRIRYSNLRKTDPISPSHVDICSYRDLRRIDPDNLKYDSFLMMAIPLILGKVRRGNN